MNKKTIDPNFGIILGHISLDPKLMWLPIFIRYFKPSAVKQITNQEKPGKILVVLEDGAKVWISSSIVK